MRGRITAGIVVGVAMLASAPALTMAEQYMMQPRVPSDRAARWICRHRRLGRATSVIAGVPVSSATSITIIGTEPAPITLQPSTTQSINGTVTLNPADDDGTVIVAAKQTLNPGPTVTVKSLTATLSTGNQPGDYEYGLTLPIGAPSLAQYSATLPITPTAAAQSAVAGRYTVQASAQTPTTVYATQSPLPSPVTITGGSATQNFTLTP